MERLPKVQFTKEFKEEAVKMVRDSGLSLKEVSRRLSLPESTLRYWVKTIDSISNNSKHQNKVITPEQMELSRLRRELAEVKMERDILKKAAAYFAKESL
jgi:transposase